MAWCFCICYRISKLHFSPSIDTDTRHCHQAKKKIPYPPIFKILIGVGGCVVVPLTSVLMF